MFFSSYVTPNTSNVDIRGESDLFEVVLECRNSAVMSKEQDPNIQSI